MKMLLSSKTLQSLITPVFAQGMMPDTIEVQSYGSLNLVSFNGTKKTPVEPVKRDWISKDVTIPFNIGKWARLYKFLYYIPEQPVVLEIDIDGEGLALSQIVAQF